jgi:hypothetical protein
MEYRSMVRTPASEVGNIGSNPVAPANFSLEYKHHSYWLYDKSGVIYFMSDLEEMVKMIEWINWCDGKLNCSNCGHPAIKHAHHHTNHYCHECSKRESPVGQCKDYKHPGVFSMLLDYLGV